MNKILNLVVVVALNLLFFVPLIKRLKERRLKEEKLKKKFLEAFDKSFKNAPRVSLDEVIAQEEK